MQRFEVGKIIESAIGHAEGPVFDIDDSGAVLVIYFNDPHDEEVNQFKAKEKFEMRLTPFTNVLMLTVKIGNLAWMDMSYNPHLSKSLTKFPIPNEGAGLALTVMLIDTRSGKVKSIRLMGLSTNFTKKLIGEALDMKARSFSESQYRNDLRSIFAKYTTKNLVKISSAYCKIN